MHIMRIVQSLFQNSKEVTSMFKKCILLWQHGWFDSATSKIQSVSGNWFKQIIWFANTFIIYCSCLQFLISSWRFWKYLMMVETEIKRVFTLYFQESTDMLLPNCKICRNSFEKKKLKVRAPLLGSRKKINL